MAENGPFTAAFGKSRFMLEMFIFMAVYMALYYCLAIYESSVAIIILINHFYRHLYVNVTPWQCQKYLNTYVYFIQLLGVS